MKLNKEFKEYTRDILENEDFKLLKNDSHHGTNRYDHCKRVSYLSFLISKIFKGNSERAIKAGLLHDYFHGTSSYLEHPSICALNAKEHFNITAEIIKTHMYHYALVQKLNPFKGKEDKKNAKEYRPTSKEGVIVCVSDLLVSIFECGIFKVRYNACLYILFIINLMRY